MNTFHRAAAIALLCCLATASCQRKATWQELIQLANSRYQEGQNQKANLAAQQARETIRKTYRPGSPGLAEPLNELGAIFNLLGQYAEAESVYVELLALDEKFLGSEHLNVARDLNNLGAAYLAVGRFDQVEPLFLRSVQICEKILGPNHPDVANPLLNLAEFYHVQERPLDVAPIYERILGIYDANLGPQHPDLVPVLEEMADFYRGIGQGEQAEKLEKRARAIREDIQ